MFQQPAKCSTDTRLLLWLQAEAWQGMQSGRRGLAVELAGWLCQILAPAASGCKRLIQQPRTSQAQSPHRLCVLELKAKGILKIRFYGELGICFPLGIYELPSYAPNPLPGSQGESQHKRLVESLCFVSFLAPPPKLHCTCLWRLKYRTLWPMAPISLWPHLFAGMCVHVYILGFLHKTSEIEPFVVGGWCGYWPGLGSTAFPAGDEPRKAKRRMPNKAWW